MRLYLLYISFSYPCPLCSPFIGSSCLPSSSFHHCHSQSDFPRKIFQLGPIQSGSLRLAWATLEKGNLGKACKVIRAAWATQGSLGSRSRSGTRSSSLSLLGMTWGLLPWECPRQCQPAIECPICGIHSSNYAQHYNRRHDQRSSCIRQRLPHGWVTEHDFLYCACGDLVSTGAKYQQSLVRHWYDPRGVHRNGQLVTVNTSPKPG